MTQTGQDIFLSCHLPSILVTYQRAPIGGAIYSRTGCAIFLAISQLGRRNCEFASKIAPCELGIITLFFCVECEGLEACRLYRNATLFLAWDIRNTVHTKFQHFYDSYDYESNFRSVGNSHLLVVQTTALKLTCFFCVCVFFSNPNDTLLRGLNEMRGEGRRT